MAQEDDLRGMGKIMVFPCCEYHTRNYECILVLLRGNAHLGSDNRGG